VAAPTDCLSLGDFNHAPQATGVIEDDDCHTHGSRKILQQPDIGVQTTGRPADAQGRAMTQYVSHSGHLFTAEHSTAFCSPPHRSSASPCVTWRLDLPYLPRPLSFSRPSAKRRRAQAGAIAQHPIDSLWPIEKGLQ
jgi:hypothetical protein